MSADPPDDAQEFAERVAEKWIDRHAAMYPALVTLIATELRTGEWVKGRAEPHVPNPVDMADFSWDPRQR